MRAPGFVLGVAAVATIPLVAAVRSPADTVATIDTLATTEAVASSPVATTAALPVEPVLPAPLADTAGWQLVFEETFAGDVLADRWTTCYWWQTDGGCTIASNHELQWYQPAAVQVRDGVLELTAAAMPQRTTDGHTLPYRSGMVSTGPVSSRGRDASFSFTYGYVEATVRVPTFAGAWPALWLLSADRTSLPEIDIFENYANRPGRFTSRVHQRVDGDKQSEGIETTDPHRATGWNTVGVLWTATKVDFFVNGQLTGSVTDPTLIPHTPMYLIINLALGGRAGPVDDASLPQSFLIDDVRIWQSTGGGS